MLKIAARRALLAVLICLTILAGPLAAQMDIYEEESGVPAKALDLFHQAQGLEQSGHVEEAIQAYQKAILLDPDYAEARQRLGLAYANLNRYPEALQEFKEVVRLQPQSAMAQGNLGAAYLKMGDFPEARGAFQKAVRLRPDDPENHYRLGLALGKMKRDREALAEFAQAVKLQPDMARAHRDLGLAYLNLGRLEEGGKALKEAAALDPKDPQVHYALSVYYARTGDVAAANREFKTLQGLDKALAQKLVEQIRQGAGLQGEYRDPHRRFPRAAARNDPEKRPLDAPPNLPETGGLQLPGGRGHPGRELLLVRRPA